MQRSLRACIWTALVCLTAHNVFATPPVISSSAIINNFSGTRFTLSLVTNQLGTAYYVISTTDTNPSAADIRAGRLGGGAQAPIRGSFGVTNAGSSNAIVQGLTTGTTYYVHFIVENSSAEQSAVHNESAVATDATAPVINPASITDVTASGFTFTFSVSERGTVYYVVTSSPSVPSSTQIIDGNNESNLPAPISGASVINAAGASTSITAQSLSSAATYYVHYLAKDASGNLSAIGTKNVTTLAADVTPPSFTSSAIVNIGMTAFDYRVNINEAATVYYVVTTTSAAPTSAQILAGNRGNFSVNAGVDKTVAVTGLTSGTDYYVHSVAVDAAGNVSAVDTETATTDCTPTTASWPGNKNAYCLGTDLSGINVTASGGPSHTWYRDAALTAVIAAGVSSPTAGQLFGTSPAAGSHTVYVTNTHGCGGAATAVTLIVNALPTADAGLPQSLCPGETLTLGGQPTASGGGGVYTYTWTSPAGVVATNANPVLPAGNNATGGDITETYTVVVADKNNCSASDNVIITIRSQPAVSVAAPLLSTYTTSHSPVPLKGSPAGGIFAGPGVRRYNGVDHFDPETAGLGLHTLVYTVVPASGCSQAVTKNFVVTEAPQAFTNLTARYCNGEGTVDLTLKPETIAEIENYIETWNTVYVPNLGYSPLKTGFRTVIRNAYTRTYGENHGVVKDPAGATYSAGGHTLDRYQLVPQAFATGQAYPTCATCTMANLSVFIEFANTTDTYPYNVSSGQDLGHVFNDGTTAAFAYTAQSVNIFPAPTSTLSVTQGGTPPTDLNFCYSENAIALAGNQPANSTGAFTIDYVNLGHTGQVTGSTLSFKPSTYYDAALAHGHTGHADAQFNITYVITDAIGCTASVSRVLTVSPQVAITISGIQPDAKFCANGDPFYITFSPAGGSLTVNGADATSQLDASSRLLSTHIPIGQGIPLRYDYRSGAAQCSNATIYTINNIAPPSARFTATPSCDGDVVTFTAEPDLISHAWTWAVDEKVLSAGTDASVFKHTFPALTGGATRASYPVRLVSESMPYGTLVCRDTATAAQVINVKPKADFTYTHVCQDDLTKFAVKSDIPLATVEWDFGDTYTLAASSLYTSIPAGTHDGKTTGIVGQPSHQFVFTPGTTNVYNARLTARTASAAGACASIIDHRIMLLQKLRPTPAAPYLMTDHESVAGLWQSEDLSGASTWAFDIPATKDKITPTAGKTWITSTTGHYSPKDNSYVNSPCFNLSAYTQPTLSLQYWNDTEAGKDGAVMQYSTDGGATWQVLGNASSGTEWYNTQDIAASPGGQRLGWSGQTQSAWRTATHPLDGLNVVNVRFRIAFASDAQQQYDGFAFNNVRIEGRQEPPVTALEPTLAAQIRVYPNPANHVLYIDLPEATREPVSLKIVDAYGREALIGEIHRGQTGTAVDAQTLAGGVYIIRLQTVGSTIHRKVMVVHE